LSRWERGQQTPRDLEQVLAAYRALEPMARTQVAESQRNRTLHYSVDQRVVAFLVGRWVLLALVVVLGVAYEGLDGSFVADSLRVFICASTAVAIGLMAYRYRRLVRHGATSTAGQLIVLSWALAVSFLAQSCGQRFGQAHVRAHTATWALLAVEVGLVGLTWRVEERLVFRRDEPTERRTPPAGAGGVS
jgi:hypothetical protein